MLLIIWYFHIYSWPSHQSLHLAWNYNWIASQDCFSGNLLYILYTKAMHQCSIKLLQEHIPVTAYRNGLFHIILRPANAKSVWREEEEKFKIQLKITNTGFHITIMNNFIFKNFWVRQSTLRLTQKLLEYKRYQHFASIKPNRQCPAALLGGII